MEHNNTSQALRGCVSSADNTFGPAIVTCRGDFDFTLLFEQIILSILPSTLLLLVVPFRLVKLYKSRTKAPQNTAFYAKTATALLLAIIELALIILWSGSPPHSRTTASMPSAVLSFLAALAILLLSPVEHARSVKPSTLLTTYLLLSLLLDVAQLRTLYLRQRETAIAAVFSATMGIKLALLWLEARGKRSYLKSPYNDLPPESTSGIVNRSFFWWLNSIFILGTKTLLSIGNLHSISPELASESLQRSLKLSWDTRTKPEGKYTLPIAVAQTIKWPLLAAVPPRLCMIGFNYAQPFLISRTIDFMYLPHDALHNKEGYGLIGATGLIYLGITLSRVHYNHRIYRAMTMFRGAMVAMIFSHTLDLQDGMCDDSAALTLMSTDIDRITTSMRRVNEVWANGLEVVIGVGLLAQQIGWICVIPVALLIICSRGSALVAKRIGGRQKIWVGAVQKRVAATASMLGSMKAVKMMGLTDIMARMIQEERVQELNLQKKFRWLTFWINVVGDIPQSFSTALVFVTFALQAKVNGSESLSTTKAFTSLALISLVSAPAAQLLVSIPSVTAALGCFQRIQEFLLSPLLSDQRNHLEINLNTNYSHTHNSLPGILRTREVELRPLKSATMTDQLGSLAIIADKIDVRPSADSDPVLRDVSLQIERGSLTMISGPVGSGKSTLLKALLGEIPCSAGSISVISPRIAYCAQSPWLVNATIMENITCVDVGAAIDEAWYNSVTYACALDQDLLQIPNGDSCMIGSRGVTLSGGQKQRVALARAVYARHDIILLDDVLSALDKKTEDMVVKRLLGSKGLFKKLGTTSILVTHTTRHYQLADKIVLLNSSGNIEQQGTFDSLRLGEGLISSNLTRMTSTSQVQTQTKPVSPIIKKLANPLSEEQAQDLTRRTGDKAVYSYYFNYIGLQDALLLLSFVITYVFALKFPQIILKWWTNDKGSHIMQWSISYTVLALISLLTNVGAIWAMMIRIGPKSAAKLHHTLLRTTMNAPQSFFSKTDTGNTLNRQVAESSVAFSKLIIPRFSQDMSLVEGSLPQAALLTIRMLVESLATAALISTGSTYMAIFIPFLFIALFFIQNIYLKTSRQLRFLDLEAKSPLYSHFLETIEGAVTIRAFGWSKRARLTNFKHIDNSQKPYYLLFCIQRWLEVVLDLMVGILAIAVVALAVSMRTSGNAALIGIALNNILSFTSTLSFLVTFWTELETSLGAIARLKTFEKSVVSEHRSEEIVVPPESWPSAGKIEIRKVGASYDSSTVALQNVSMTINPGEKVVICGRTGTGKSTLISTLLRLLDIDSGEILIDGLDITTVNRSHLRERLTTVPQDPFILNGSIRLNADPTGTISDDSIISTLQTLHLWPAIEARGGLDAQINAQPLSQGQQQVFGLARALLKKSKILILDEATSNVDLETDKLMQDIIQREFRDCTVVMIAHRLDTIKDADKVAVMDEGRVIEFDSPAELMARDSAFKQLHNR